MLLKTLPVTFSIRVREDLFRGLEVEL